MDITEITRTLTRIRDNVSKVIVGKEAVTESVLTALLAGGHVLIEDVPGTGKTTLAAALARSLALSFTRVQFTPDVLPSDVTGFVSYDLKTGEKRLNPGAVMSNLLLADEINRTSPKTQSSLLEVMAEGSVTLDGETMAVPQPFMVLATQNPVEQVGTYPLPEAQLDRFMMKISMGYPTHEQEIDLLVRNRGARPLDALEPVATAEDILAAREAAAAVTCAPPVLDYIVTIAEETRRDEKLELGVSPRGSLALMNAAMARALLKGRDYVLPDDVQALAPCVLAHRLTLNARSSLGSDTAAGLLKQILRSVRVPAAT